jgi:hydroxymethylglutaryl-CoA synthase
MKLGIEKINVYAGGMSLDAVALAEARGLTRERATTELMLGTRSVLPPYEDAVTLAVNAGKRLLADADRADIGLLIVATESAVDFGKPVSTWVHRFCGLPSNCRNFEIKHACYGGTAAMRMATAWLETEGAKGKKALVISSDYTRPNLDDQFDFTGGACAVAMLLGRDPALVTFDGARAGYWTTEIADTFRPTASAEVVDSQVSLSSYLDALEGAYEHYEQMVGGPVDYQSYFKKHVYHAPFPGMTFQAHRALLRRLDFSGGKAQIMADFNEKVAESLGLAKRIGTSYGASTFLGMMSLLSAARSLSPDDKISVFAYGSGCQAELYEASIVEGAQEKVRALEIGHHLEERFPITVEQYEANERARLVLSDGGDFTARFDESGDAYRESYAGKGRLVLKQVKGYYRTYELS